MNKIAKKVQELAAPVAEEQGLEIWDVEYVREAGQWFLRIYIDRDGGVDLDACERFSRAVDPLLDAADPIPDSYVFEVSSAGAERVLKRPSDFTRFMGSLVEVRLYQPKDGAKLYTGTLTGWDSGDVTLRCPDGAERRFPGASVAQVRLRIE